MEIEDLTEDITDPRLPRRDYSAEDNTIVFEDSNNPDNKTNEVDDASDDEDNVVFASASSMDMSDSGSTISVPAGVPNRSATTPRKSTSIGMRVPVDYLGVVRQQDD